MTSVYLPYARLASERLQDALFLKLSRLRSRAASYNSKLRLRTYSHTAKLQIVTRSISPENRRFDMPSQVSLITTPTFP